ncbi:MAG: carbamoyl phosphate synthase small subunit [Solobacterium sp.]|nr:carbamoyl phosphate synthase small subunit [Solobacterium sp.]
MKNRRKAWLVLKDGSVYEGQAIGADRDCLGELVFTTGMNGYIETLTDPSYAGQIVIQTFPLVGNYGIIPEDFEGKPHLRGYVVRELCETPSNFRSEGTVESFLAEHDIPGIAGIDTRQLTRKLREYGVMNAAIVRTRPESSEDLERFFIHGVVEECSVKKPVKHECMDARRRVVLIDYGAKENIIRELTSRSCEVIAVPYNTPAAKIRALLPDGVMLSNGPGDPAENTEAIAVIRELLGTVPVFGICLGHQLTALAAGASTYKMKYGHRGANQPVSDTITGRTFITTQNHGYAVDPASIRDHGTVRYINANDGTCEGIDYPGLSCFTVQFHPEACAGPKDTEFLFDRFIAMMEEFRHAKGHHD